MSNKVALITGGARRVGAIIARALHQSAYNVVLHYRHSKEEAEALADELNALRENSAIISPADLNAMDTLPTLMESALKKWGRLDLLVNNASSFYPTPILESTTTQWDDLINSNIKGAYFLSTQAAPHLAKNKGHIVNIIDIYSQKPLKNYSIYCIAKAGLLMMTKSLALELAPDIAVNGISPGTTLWPEGMNALDEKMQEELLKKTLLNRKADPKDIANAVLFFANSTSVTGQILAIDSGRSVK
jgi:pteridine reductase